MDPQLLIWLVTGVVFVIGVMWLISKAIKGGSKASTPETPVSEAADPAQRGSHSSSNHS